MLSGLTERYLRAVEQRSDLCLRLGRCSAVVQEPSVVVPQHPFRERLAGQLMIGLVKSGRRADALAAYDWLRRSLAAELGIDPVRRCRRSRAGSSARIRAGWCATGAAGPTGCASSRFQAR